MLKLNTMMPSITDLSALTTTALERHLKRQFI
jgi:hypothetical protein